MTKRFRRRGPRLYTPSGRTVEFPHPIEQLLGCGGVAVVRLDPSGDNRNIYGVSRAGRILWQLRKSPFTTKDVCDPYIELHRLPDCVRVFSFRGQIYDVEQRTGRILGSGWAK